MHSKHRSSNILSLRTPRKLLLAFESPALWQGRARRNAELQQLWELMNSSEHDALCSMLASQKRDLDEAEWELQQTLEEVMLNCKQRKVYM